MPPKPIPSPLLLRTLRALTSPSRSSFTPPHPHTPLRSHCSRHLHTSPRALSPQQPSTLPQTPTPTSNRSHDRGPISEETTQTDFAISDIYARAPAPTNSIDACLPHGFHLANGVKIANAGLLLVSGEAFAWTPWGNNDNNNGNSMSIEGAKGLINAKGQLDIDFKEGVEGWGLLKVVWPRPEMLILGTGPLMRPLSPRTREAIQELGIRVEIADTRNAAAQFNLLATERGVGSIAAALVPVGWKEGVGKKGR